MNIETKKIINKINNEGKCIITLRRNSGIIFIKLYEKQKCNHLIYEEKKLMEEVDRKKGLKMSESAETSEVKAATLTNHPYGAGPAEQQAAIEFMGRRD